MASTEGAPNGEGEIVATGSQTTNKTEIAERTAAVEDAQTTGEISKNAAKKAAKREKAAAEKASKGPKPIGNAEAKQPTSSAPKKSKKTEGADEKSIDIKRETDFSGWYQQVLTKGEMLDYYDVSGCYILKVHELILLDATAN